MADDIPKPPSSVATLQQEGDLLVTPHFRVSEFDCPARYGLKLAPYPEEWIATRLRPLCELLEQLRAVLGVPIQVIGGYRAAEWNRRHIEAGHDASPHSQHLEGRAADIQARGRTPEQIHAAALRLHHQGAIRLGGLGLYRRFVHVDQKPGDLRRWTR